jgi:hypothetical protein
MTKLLIKNQNSPYIFPTKNKKDPMSFALKNTKITLKLRKYP